jgi:hypothetical protein
MLVTCVASNGGARSPALASSTSFLAISVVFSVSDSQRLQHALKDVTENGRFFRFEKRLILENVAYRHGIPSCCAFREHLCGNVTGLINNGARLSRFRECNVCDEYILSRAQQTKGAPRAARLYARQRHFETRRRCAFPIARRHARIGGLGWRVGVLQH